MKNKKIGIFDSGIGGITVLKELLKILPNENYIYCSDNINAPYGSKDPLLVKNFCLNIIDLFNANECKIAIIACNTATACALDSIKQNANMPVIDVVSNGIQHASEITKNKKICIMATKLTVDSKIYLNGLKAINRDFEISQIKCPKLGGMIENGWKSRNRFKVLEEYMQKIPKNVDTLILGCTHYPLIKSHIRKNFKKSIIDPASRTAIEAKKLLTKKQLLNEKERGSILFCMNTNMQKITTLLQLNDI